MQEIMTLRALQANSQLGGAEYDENASPLFVTTSNPWLMAPAAIKMPASQVEPTHQGRNQKLFH